MSKKRSMAESTIVDECEGWNVVPLSVEKLIFPPSPPNGNVDDGRFDAYKKYRWGPAVRRFRFGGNGFNRPGPATREAVKNFTKLFKIEEEFDCEIVRGGYIWRLLNDLNRHLYLLNPKDKHVYGDGPVRDWKCGELVALFKENNGKIHEGPTIDWQALVKWENQWRDFSSEIEKLYSRFVASLPNYLHSPSEFGSNESLSDVLLGNGDVSLGTENLFLLPLHESDTGKISVGYSSKQKEALHALDIAIDALGVAVKQVGKACKDRSDGGDYPSKLKNVFVELGKLFGNTKIAKLIFESTTAWRHAPCNRFLIYFDQQLQNEAHRETEKRHPGIRRDSPLFKTTVEEIYQHRKERKEEILANRIKDFRRRYRQSIKQTKSPIGD